MFTKVLRIDRFFKCISISRSGNSRGRERSGGIFRRRGGRRRGLRVWRDITATAATTTERGSSCRERVIDCDFAVTAAAAAAKCPGCCSSDPGTSHAGASPAGTTSSPSSETPRPTHGPSSWPSTRWGLDVLCWEGWSLADSAGSLAVRKLQDVLQMECLYPVTGTCLSFSLNPHCSALLLRHWGSCRCNRPDGRCLC